MNNKDYLVTSFPSTPKTERIGILTWPYLVQLIGKAFNIEHIYSINLINSFMSPSKEKVQEYIDFLTQNGIELDNIFFDYEHLDKMKNIIENMYYSKLIKKEKLTIYKCDCGKVDGIITELNFQNKNAKLYSTNNGKPICNFCNTECKPYEKKVLVLPINTRNIQEINIVPAYLKQYFIDIYKKFDNQKFVISKIRETGVKVCLDGEYFNIDVDFTWMLFSSLLPNKNKIIIAGNRHIFKMLKAHYVNSILQQKPITFLASSYNVKNPNFDETKAFFEEEDYNYKKLFLLYHQRWNNHSQPRMWDRSIYRFLKGISKEKRLLLYNSILNTNIDLNNTIEENLTLLVKNINLAKNNKEINNKITN